MTLLFATILASVLIWQWFPAGAVVQSLTNSSITPLTIFAFTFSIPYLQDSPELGAQFIAGSAVLVAGLATYNLPKWKPWLTEKFSK